ncbi:M15 family metallopeptidase [Nocardioides sp. MH1]|uniref:M15 family metallopeptidase n=1 Tax=Nocardioides sp. MH1 TaxID=3242490 RepID=UPI0035229148
MGVAQRTRARLALVGAVALLSAACTGPSEEPGTDTSNAASSTSTGAPGSDGPSDPADPQATYAVHTVDDPGPRKGALYGDDMLLVSAKTIPDDVLKQIMAIRIAGEKAVYAAVPMSIGQFSVENKSYRIASADIAGYRSFLESRGADYQPQWDRIAAGEMGVSEDLKKRLPLDKDGYLAVGSGEKTFPIHVGAYSPEVGTIDFFVNQAWGDALDLPEDNALVLNTGTISPQALKKKLKPIVGDISMTDLDIVAERGLDPGTIQSVQVIGTYAEAVGVFRYTPIGGGRVQPEASWVKAHIVTDTVPLLGTVTCNKFMMPQLKAALAEVVHEGLSKEVYQTAGCYYPRYIAGTTTLSNHSFGLAIDINSTENQRGTVGQMSRAVVAIFQRCGFTWGGDWHYTDPMHFELDRIVNCG